MYKQETKRWLLAVLIFTIACMAMVIVNVNQKKMYSVDFFDDRGKVVKVLTDEDGIIRQADTDRDTWVNQIIISIRLLKEGDMMEMYNLLTNTFVPVQYRVLHIAPEK